MIQIDCKPIAWLPDEDVKIAAANKQMQALMARLVDAPKYHTLTIEDRKQLVSEGYAPDLVDNLVFITLRLTGLTEDLVNVGFNYAAFDTALFASDHLKAHLQQLSNGCCAYCESYLLATNSGEVGHFRPVELLERPVSTHLGVVATCSPYFSLAYDQNNLLFVCNACHEQYKGGQFPLVGKRAPLINIEQEQPLLVCPYLEDPRQFVRFDPQSGRAYAFDVLSTFLMDSKSISHREAEQLVWSQPELLKESHDLMESPAFTRWLQSLDKDSAIQLTKGQTTIEILGLNRSELVISRLNAIGQLHFAYERFKLSKNDDLPAFIDSLPLLQYRSLAIDALHTWHNQQSPQTTADNTTTPQNQPSSLPFPNWFRASLRYCVEESNLADNHKRNLVFLSANDRLYGQKAKERCVFLPVNWKQDKHKLIKVRSQRNIWETSLSELADSRPLELINLFTHNDVWVEGPFEALHSA
ncbi:hypothetical protein BB427_08515 [Pseudoalteromonas sp. BMB]|uniref:hypothetical protein n=1 Tax=Pseudoalteromonas sp. BMB TaxID=1874619 RepID=UPI00083D3189|nr:hypothetical protein [Pseudoalteromonas sp. BMB]ODB42272.1 hypothetical protein BB427_08515 [Pseudoalteromonas sp. BMB]